MVGQQSLSGSSRPQFVLVKGRLYLVGDGRKKWPLSLSHTAQSVPDSARAEAELSRVGS